MKLEDELRKYFGIENYSKRTPVRQIIKSTLQVVAAAEDAIEQIKSQKALWPAEVDILEDKLISLKALLAKL